MPKNIVVCLDGTGNQLKATATTELEITVRNAGQDAVPNLAVSVNGFDSRAEHADLADPSRQVAYYDPGVGTMGARGAWR